MFYRARILSYTPEKRTAQVHIFGLTDGASDGLTATFAYAVGEDDRDTEIKIVNDNDVYVFFEGGDQSRPVIAFYSSHGQNNIKDIRRIQQKNIEILAETKTTIKAQTVHIKGNVIIDGDIQHNGNQKTSGDIKASGDVKAGAISLTTHKHGGVKGGEGMTTPSVP